jgi:hypothetical protein
MILTLSVSKPGRKPKRIVTSINGYERIEEFEPLLRKLIEIEGEINSIVGSNMKISFSVSKDYTD